MFDIGFPELLIVSVVALLVLGPERLPEAVRTLGLWIGRLRRSFQSIKAEIEREIGADEIRREIYNEQVLEQSGKFRSELESVVDEFNRPLEPGASDGDAADEEAHTAEKPLPAGRRSGDDDPDSAER